VTDWSHLFLAVIAGSTLVMALIHVGAVIVAARVARQAQSAVGTAQQAIAAAQQTLLSVREEIRPLLAKATAIADEASRSASLATAQVEKTDRLVTDLARRIDETAAIVQQAIVTPAREGIAIVAGLKAAFSVFRNGGDPRRRASRSEEEDPLFIG
jgi:predicted PurR-regulated permease PerM